MCSHTHTNTNREREGERARIHTNIHTNFCGVHGPHITHTHQFTTQIFADQHIHVTALHSLGVWGCGVLGVLGCGGGV